MRYHSHQTPKPILTGNRFLGLLLLGLFIFSHRKANPNVNHHSKAWAWILLLLSLFGLIGVGTAYAINHFHNQPIQQSLSQLSTDPVQTRQLASSRPNWADQFNGLRRQNTDLQAILTIPETSINHPVMHTPNDSENEDFYLRRNFAKRDDIKGTLFFDKRNNLMTRDQNLIIYGHNFPDGSMFGELEKYKNPDFYQQHRFLYLYRAKQSDNKTIYQTEKYQIFAVFRSKVYYSTDRVFKYYQFYNAKSSDELKGIINSIKSMVLYSTEAINNITIDDQFLTLSTCEYSQDHGRLVIIGKLIK